MKKHQIFTLMMLFFLGGGLSSAYASNECSAVVDDFWRGSKKTDITFVAFGDTQFGHNFSRKDKERSCYFDNNKMMINAINSLTSHKWPGDFKTVKSNTHGKKISNIRGVLIAGDMLESNYYNTSDKQDKEYKSSMSAFKNNYGICGEKKLKYPVFEGYGNHDYQWDKDQDYIHPAIKAVVSRNDKRTTKSKDKKHGHYSWAWDNVHFVNLNLTASDNDDNNKHYIVDKRFAGKGVRRLNPFSSLSFLKKDLKAHAKNKKPVVIMMHYPFWNRSRMTDNERKKFHDVIKDYNVIAIIHGHTHQTGKRRWNSLKQTKGIRENNLNIPVLDVGSPFFAKSSDNNEYRSSFTLVRITDDKLEAVNYSISPICSRDFTAKKHKNTFIYEGFELDEDESWSISVNLK